jgi:hypothetical protein
LELKHKTAKQGDSGSQRNKLAAKAVLVSAFTASMIGCAPDVKVVNIIDSPDSGMPAECSAVKSCDTRTAYLRESGSTAGPNSMSVDEAKLTLTQVADVDGTKAVTLEFSGCEAKATGTFKPGEKSILSAKNDSVEVDVKEVGYDSSGLRVKVAVAPVAVDSKSCEEQDGGQSDGGASQDGS